jgi:hypothetical protein
VIAHQTDTVKNWMKTSREKGLKGVLTKRDRPFCEEGITEEEIVPRGTMIKRAIIVAAAFFLVACNSGELPGEASSETSTRLRA